MIILKNLNLDMAYLRYLLINIAYNGIPVSHYEQNYLYPYLHYYLAQKLCPQVAIVIILADGV
jgi:hypothetical protein